MVLGSTKKTLLPDKSWDSEVYEREREWEIEKERERERGEGERERDS
jgi:hypothetical protein